MYHVRYEGMKNDVDWFHDDTNSHELFSCVILKSGSCHLIPLGIPDDISEQKGYIFLFGKFKFSGKFFCIVVVGSKDRIFPSIPNLRRWNKVLINCCWKSLYYAILESITRPFQFETIFSRKKIKTLAGLDDSNLEPQNTIFTISRRVETEGQWKNLSFSALQFLW